MMSRKWIVAIPIVGGAMMYDEDRRLKYYYTAQASYRIGNLVSTVATIVIDYGYAMTFNNGDRTVNVRYDQLSSDIERLQQRQEDLTTRQMKSTDEKEISNLLAEIALTRISLDSTAEEIGQLNAVNDNFQPLKAVHNRCAIRLRDMCANNLGVYIKLGQHIAMLDHVFPEEYHRHLSTLLSKTPQSSYEAVRRVIKKDLGGYPEDIFSNFSKTPIASASLAQVHIAYSKDGKHKYAVKVQHEGLLDNATGDMATITFLILMVYRLFPFADYRWLTNEMNANLPLELDFKVEAGNLEKCRLLMRNMIESGDIAVPALYPEFSSTRVLTMGFEEGSYVTNQAAIQQLGLNKMDVSSIVAKIFCEQMYRHGFVHCDPHEANLLVRAHPNKKGYPQIVLLDHGLYKELGDDFRKAYSRLWRGLIMADEKIIKEECQKMKSGAAYTLLAAMLTMRPWDDVVSPDVERLKSKNTKGEAVMLRAYAKKYFPDILSMLGVLPSELLLLLKTNDCLRHIDKQLGTPVNSAAVVGATIAEVSFWEDVEGKNVTQWGPALREWWSLIVRVKGLGFLSYLLAIVPVFQKFQLTVQQKTSNFYNSFFSILFATKNIEA